MTAQSNPWTLPLPQQDLPAGAWAWSKGRKNYVPIAIGIKDHRSNVYVVVTDLKLGQDTNNDVTQAEYYFADVQQAQENASKALYAFGMIMPGRNYDSPSYRYGYNGKEKDNEMKGSGNSYDFGARFFDGRLGRWMSADPSETKLPGQSTYCGVDDNPINRMDPDGETGVAVMRGHKIIIKSNYYFYGGEATPKLAKALAKQIEKAWNEPHGKKTIGSTDYKVKFKVRGSYIGKDETNAISMMSDPNRTEEDSYKQNFIRLEKSPLSGEMGSETWDNTGYWATSQFDTQPIPVHEAGHGWGWFPFAKQAESIKKCIDDGLIKPSDVYQAEFHDYLGHRFKDTGSFIPGVMMEGKASILTLGMINKCSINSEYTKKDQSGNFVVDQSKLKPLASDIQSLTISFSDTARRKGFAAGRTPNSRVYDSNGNFIDISSK